MDQKRVSKLLNPKVPAGIQFVWDKEQITLKLSKNAIGIAEKKNSNMQADEAAFEGWAVAVYVHGLAPGGTIMLDVQDDVAMPAPKSGTALHYNRFLYRALRFCQQYSWCRMSERLQTEATVFEKLFLSEQSCVNNCPTGDAGENDKLENQVENSFIQRPSQLWDIYVQAGHERPVSLYSQLPVGIFAGEKASKNAIFPHRKAAIDLWCTEDDGITLFELKARNKMMGAVTELFFYANYLYDLYCRENNWIISDGADYRGYAALKNGTFHKVNAVLLADEIHPMIDGSLFDTLNGGTLSEILHYKKCVYELEKVRGEGKAL